MESIPLCSRMWVVKGIMAALPRTRCVRCGVPVQGLGRREDITARTAPVARAGGLASLLLCDRRPGGVGVESAHASGGVRRALAQVTLPDDAVLIDDEGRHAARPIDRGPGDERVA